MSVTIFHVRPGSIAEQKKLHPGDRLLSINHNPINDVLDYDFHAADSRLSLEVEGADGKRTLRIRKDEYENLGLEFETYLIDEQRSCRNNCIFCFVDQMPPGLRDSLYFKDDDDRLSFLFGNYVTLTNMPPEEIDRIIYMHISPINISVHTTNPELRVRMMKNRFAGDSLAHLRKLAEAGVRLNCQLVLCPGINDGEELSRSLRDLAAFYPAVQSIACVPVGLTKYRDGLYPLEPYDQQSALQVIACVEEFSTRFFQEHVCRLAFPADEFFLKAGKPLPDGTYYEDFDQLENGVGVIALFSQEFRTELAEWEPKNVSVRRITLATGVDAFPFLQELVDECALKWHNLKCEVVAVENRFFGSSITVAGLVTGRDLLDSLSERELGEELLLPSVMLRHEQDRFLDDVTLSEVSEKLGIPVRVCEIDGGELVHALLGE